METSLVQLIGQPKPPIPWPKHLLARAEARVMEPPLDPMMCQEQTAIARTFNDERFQEWEERRARKQVEEQKQLGLAVELAQASVFDQEAPLLLRLQKMLGRARSSSRSRSRGATSTSDGESEASGSGSSTSEECEDLEEEIRRARLELASRDTAKAAAQPPEPARSMEDHISFWDLMTRCAQKRDECREWLAESRAKLQEKLKAHTEEELAEAVDNDCDIPEPEGAPALL
ncbi:unnamed protein product [Effrenium voratum]|uniref:Uncharacterized protein n=1 Tax=Effrenium voratum TaxID=2562239 RepID=A0AA36MQT2_9DINO|nr:unnamed protein product [Effrenium voratum]